MNLSRPQRILVNVCIITLFICGLFATLSAELRDEAAPSTVSRPIQTQYPYLSTQSITPVNQTPEPQQSLSLAPQADTSPYLRYINQRFVGLLSHVYWLQENRSGAPAARGNNESRLERQVFSIMDETADDFRSLEEQFDTNVLTVNGTTTIAEGATIAGGLGIGAEVPARGINIARGDLSVVTTNEDSGDIYLRSFVDTPLWRSGAIAFERAGGTLENPTYVTTGQNLGYVTFRNHTRGNGASIIAVATEQHSPTTSGTRIDFTTVPNGSNNPQIQMRLAETGNLGLGITDPLERLSVDGAIFLEQISAPATTTNRLYNELGSLYWNGSVIAGAAVGNWDTDGTNLFRTAGNVGIGTSTPQAKLDVVGNMRVGTATSTFFNIDPSNTLVTIGTKTVPSGMASTLNNENSLFVERLATSRDILIGVEDGVAGLVLGGNFSSTTNSNADIRFDTSYLRFYSRRSALDTTNRGLEGYFGELARLTDDGRFGLGTRFP